MLNKYLKKSLIRKISQKPKVPWTKLLTSIPFWAVIIAHFGNNWGFLMVLTLLPTYFERILGLNIKKVIIFNLIDK